MTTSRNSRSLGLAALLTLLSGAIPANAAPKLIPFQGRLTDAAGGAIADGTKVVRFQLFSAVSGGSAVWNGEVQKLTVNGGLVNTMLGSKSDLTAVNFNNPLFLEITVDANNDGQITSADAPLLPRQSLVPSFFAADSANSAKLNGYDWSAILENGATNPTTAKISATRLPDGAGTPVGAVIMWWGTRATIPAGFEECNGANVSTPNAVLTGAKPNLQDRFAKGAASTTNDVKTRPPGGSNDTLAMVTGGTSLTLNQMPKHGHSASAQPITSLSVDYGDTGLTFGSGDTSFNYDNNEVPVNVSVGTEGGPSDPNAPYGASDPHTHTIPAQAGANQPAFTELFYIIKVK